MDKMLQDLAAIQSAPRAAEFIDNHRHAIAQNAEDSRKLKALEKAMAESDNRKWEDHELPWIRKRAEEIMRENKK